MLAVEVSPRVIRVAEFVPNTVPVQVTLAATMERPGGEPAVVGQALRGFLGERGFTATRALVSYSGPVIEHRIYPLPPANRESREALLRGKVAQEISTPVAELRVSGEVVGKLTEGGVERQEVLTAFTPEFEIRRLTFLLIEAGISPARVASVPLALAALHPGDQKEVLAGFVHSEPGRGVIGISDGGKLRFAREFALETPVRAAAAAPDIPDYKTLDLEGAETAAESSVPSDEEALAERMVTELTRSLLYFRQLSRGGAISRLYWSGERPSSEATRLIRERLKLEILPHPAASASVFGPGPQGDPAEFGVPIGLAVAGQVPDQINLLPEGYLRREKRRGNLAAAVVLAAVFLAANIALYAGLNNAAVRYREVLAGTAEVSQRSAGMQEGFARWVSLRKASMEASSGERALRTPFTRWKALFASLGAPVPPEMAFTSVTVDREGAGYRGELRGKVRGKNAAEAQEKVNGFLAAVRRQGMAAEPRYVPVEVRPLRAGEGAAYEQEFLVAFRLSADGEEATGDGKP
ncbi:MAG: hypothetical protein C3F14_06365 [Deltaproteobacteria bacterium]|nr:MAG: hypothetical protein C3F14_06365 [Deltaproteobacteria bacterium]